MRIRIFIVSSLVVLISVLLGCGENAGPTGSGDPGDSPPSGLSWVHPKPMGDDIGFIWGEFNEPSLRWVWGVGAQSWEVDQWIDREDLPSSRPACVNSLNDMWSFEPEGGPIWHFDGSTTEFIYPYGARQGEIAVPPEIRAIWGLGPDCAFVAIDYDVHEYDGTGWSSNRVNRVTDLWGTSRENVFSVYGPLIQHYDGEEWVIMHAQEGCYFFSLHGYSSEEIYALDRDGKIAHFDGATWELLPIIPFGDENYSNMWANSPQDILAMEANGSIAHWNGASWAEIERDAAYKPSLKSCWGDRAGNYWLVGNYGATYRFDGNTLSSEFEISILPEDENQMWLPDLSHVVALSMEDIFILPSSGFLDGGTSILRLEGAGWVPEDLGVHGVGINSITSINDRIFAVGDGGMLLERVNGIWLEHQMNTYADLLTIWGRGDGILFVGGEDGFVSVYDGNEWNHEQLGVSGPVSCMGGTAGGEVFALVGFQTIYRYDGDYWGIHLDLDFGSWWVYSLWEAGGHVFYELDDVLYCNDGSGWTTLGELPEGVKSMGYHEDVGWIAIGSYGLVMHFDGTDWTDLSFNSRRSLSDISVTENGSMVIVGSDATVLRYEP